MYTEQALPNYPVALLASRTSAEEGLPLKESEEKILTNIYESPVVL